MKEFILPSLIVGIIGAIWFHFVYTEAVHVLVYFIPGFIGAAYSLIWGEGEEKNPLVGFFGGQVIIPIAGILVYYFPILVLPWIVFALVTKIFDKREKV
jgi:hypothetical protein